MKKKYLRNRPQKESEIQRSIIEWLQWNGFLVIKINNTGIFNQRTGSYIPPRQKGISDLIALKDGRFYAIECKRPSGKLTEAQEAFLKEVEAHGGIALVARSIDDLSGL